MKRLKTIFACMLMTLLSIGQVWATATYTMKTSGSNSTTIEDNWTANTAAAFNNSGAYWACGATTNTFTITSGSGITGTITKVQVTGKRNKDKSYSINVTVGGSALGSTFNGSGNATYDTEDTFSSSTGLTGTIIVSVSAAGGTVSADKGSFWITSIIVTTASGSTATLSSLAVSGTPETVDYVDGDAFNAAGLTVTGTYSDESEKTETSGITWTACKTADGTYVALSNAAVKLEEDETEIYVKATIGQITSPAFHVTGLTVAAAPVIVSDIDDIEDGASYYIRGVRSNGSVVEYLTFTDGTAGASISGTSASSTQDAIAITFNKVSDGVYQLVTPEGLYVQPGASNSKIALSTSATTCNLANTTKTWDNSAAIAISTVDGSSNTWIIQKNTSGTNFGGYKNSGYDVTLVYASAPATVVKPTIEGTVKFLNSTTVTISHDDADHIYYTTNGNAPTTSSTEYSGSFSLTETATVKAIAVKGGASSAVAEKEFTKVVPLETMAAVQAAATSTDEQSISVAISNWVVTAVSGSQVWIADADNTKGILLYKSSHGLEAGKKLNGTVIDTKIKLYNLYPELSSLVATEVTVTDAEAITPRTTTIADLTSGHPEEQGTVVKLEGVTYSSSGLSDGVNTIDADNKFYSSLALVDGTTYDITGVVTYYKSGNDAVVKIAPRSAADVEAQSVVVIPTAANLAALKAAERGTYILTLENAVVSYVNGKNAFIEDATGGALIFIQDHGFTAGDCLNGDYQVVTTDHQGKFEITAIEPQAGAATTTAAIPLTTVSIATLNASFGSYESRRVKIVGANVTDAISGSDRNGAINDGAALAVYAAAGASTITLTTNDNVDIIGYPGFYNTNQQFNVWAQADITVNVKEDPELAYNPTEVNIFLSDLASFTPAVLEYATGFDGLAAITYESSDPSIATVETDGTVTLVATEEGFTTITATFAGNSTYKADNASYTINVGAVLPYSMTFNLDKVSYDDASAAQVVWNSNVATMTIDQNDGTAVNNYLPGGYTSGQTIAPITESRFYTKNSISFAPKSGITITKVEWLATTATYASNLANETWVDADAVVDGTNNKLVIITPSSTGEFSVTLTAQVRATEAKVYYQAESEKARLTASIDIADFDMEIGQDDILLSDVVVTTSNPNKKAISYAVTSGSEYVSITGTNANQAFHALAAGTATITATIPSDLGNYTGATTTFEIEVKAATKLDAELAYDPESVVLTVGGTFNQAELTYATNFDGLADITYESSNENLATVAADGTVTLAEGKTGTATITATFPGNDNYYNDEASYTITVNEAADDVTGTWTLVTNAANLAANKKVIVAQYVSEGDDIFTLGKQNGNNRLAIASTVSGSTLSPASGTKVITLVDAGNGLYALKLSNDKYLNASGGTSDNHLKEADDYSELVSAQWSIEITDNKAIITANFSGTNARNHMRYNPNNTNPDIFSCYKSGQNDIALYMLEEDEPEPPVVDYTEVRNGLTEGWYYTMCLDKAVTAVQGGTIWRVLSKAENGTDVILEEAVLPLVAGRPYIFLAAASTLEVAYTGDAVLAPVTEGNNGLVGSFSETKIDQSPNNYIIYNNALYYVNSNNVYVGEHRAYLDMTGVPAYSTQGNAPGRRRVVMNVYNGNQMPTGIEGIEVIEAPRKVMIDGQLFILRDKKMYDASGRLVK